MESSVTYNLEQCIDHIGFGRFQWRFAIILGFFSMTEAMEMMLLSIVGPALKCYWPDVTDFQVASLTSVLRKSTPINILCIVTYGVFLLVRIPWYDDWRVVLWNIG